MMFFTATVAQQAPKVEERQKPVYCAPFADLVNFLKSPPYNEIPTWMARDGTTDSRYVLFVNPTTGGWTLVQFGTTTGCVLGTGSESQTVENREKI